MRIVSRMGMGMGVALLLAAAASGAWEATTKIGGDGGVEYWSPRVDSAVSGWSAAAWIEQVDLTKHVFGARHDGASWQTTSLLDGAASGTPANVRVAVGEDGTATVAWVGEGLDPALWTATHGAAGWEPAVRIDGPEDESIAGPSIGAGPDGQVVVGWVEGDVFRVRVRTGGVWWAPVDLSTDELHHDAGMTGYATMDVTGHALAVWSQFDGVNSRIYASHFRQAAWSRPASIDTDAVFESWAPHVAMDGQGNGAAVWVHNPGGAWRVKGAFFHDDAWDASVHLDADPTTGYGEAFAPYVDVAPGGVACAAYDKVSPTFDITTMATFGTGYAWAGWSLPSGGAATFASVPAVDAAGRGRVVYENDEGVHLVTYGVEGPLPPVPLGDGELHDGSPWLSAGADGAAMAVFIQDGAVVATHHDAAPPVDPKLFPQIRKVKAKSGAAGTLIVFRGKKFGKGEGTVRFGDEPAQVRRWKKSQVQAFIPPGFGDVTVTLSTADGLSVEHQFAYGVPTIKKLKPKRGQRVGKKVTLKGKAFGAPGPGCAVWFGASEIAYDDPRIVKWKDKVVKIEVPDGDGQVNVHVVTPAGATEPTLFTYR